MDKMNYTKLTKKIKSEKEKIILKKQKENDIKKEKSNNITKILKFFYFVF